MAGMGTAILHSSSAAFTEAVVSGSPVIPAFVKKSLTESEDWLIEKRLDLSLQSVEMTVCPPNAFVMAVIDCGACLNLACLLRSGMMFGSLLAVFLKWVT